MVGIYIYLYRHTHNMDSYVFKRHDVTFVPCLFLSHVLSGRYDLHVPVVSCNQCSSQWSPDVNNFIRSGYWPATMQAQTLFHTDLFHSFDAMKTAAPGMSRQAFTSMLDQRTKQFGRVSNYFDHVVGQLYSSDFYFIILFLSFRLA